MDPAPHPRLPQVRVDQPGAAGRVAVPPEHRRDPAADEPAHVPAHAQGAGRCDAAAEQMIRPTKVPISPSKCDSTDGMPLVNTTPGHSLQGKT